MSPEEQGLVAAVQRMSAAGVEVLAQDFRELLEREGNVTSSEWVKVVRFAAAQAGLWRARWAFSPAASPDAVAGEEADAWDATYEGCLRTLVEHVPDLRESMERSAELMALQPALLRRVASGKGRPLSRGLFVLQSKFGIFANRIGLRALGGALYRRGLYPRGTVGRNAG